MGIKFRSMCDVIFISDCGYEINEQSGKEKGTKLYVTITLRMYHTITLLYPTLRHPAITSIYTPVPVGPSRPLIDNCSGLSLLL